MSSRYACAGSRRGRLGGRFSAALLVGTALCCAALDAAPAGESLTNGLASWYGEEHRGKLMANGKPFDPDKLTAASWFYPLGTRVQVTLSCDSQPSRSVIVTITDRGPARDLARAGRIIDLSHAAFSKVASPSSGLVAVTVQPL